MFYSEYIFSFIYYFLMVINYVCDSFIIVDEENVERLIFLDGKLID